MKLKKKVKTLDGIDAAFHALYEQKDGEFVLQVEGDEDKDDIIKGLRSEAAAARVKNRDLTNQLASFGDLKPEEVKAALLQLESTKAELEASGSKSAEAITKAVNARLNQETAPLHLKIKELETANGTLKTENEGHVKTNQTRQIHAAMIAACTKLGCASSAYTQGDDPDDVPDALSWASANAVLGADGKVTSKKDGLPLEQALRLIQDGGRRSHWWGTSGGGGATGGGANPSARVNPFMADTWSITEQGKIIASDPKLAESLAKLGGVTVGAPFHPKNGPPKTQLF